MELSGTVLLLQKYCLLTPEANCILAYAELETRPYYHYNSQDVGLFA